MDCTWLPRDEYERRRADRLERAFQRQASQGQIAAPSVQSDGLGLHGLKSMADGKMYDSKAAMRAEYRRLGFVEVGNDSSLTSGKRKASESRDEKDRRRKAVRESIEKATALVSDKTPGGWDL